MPRPSMNTKNKTSRKKSGSSRSNKAATNRKAASAKRNELTNKLREDIKTTKKTFNTFKVAAKAEVAVLRDELKAALKREKELMKMGENKIRMMLSAGEKWEKQQINKIKKMTTGKKRKK